MDGRHVEYERKVMSLSDFIPADVVFPRPAVIAEDLAAPVTGNGHPLQLAPAVPADGDLFFELGPAVILAGPGAAVVFRQEMVKTEDISAPRARERRFAKSLPADMAPVHHA